MQLSVVLADKVDTTILGYALPDAQPGPSITVYQNVSKPFFQIRQTSWTLAYLVVPAVASLAASRDKKGLDHIKYDGTRFLVRIDLAGYAPCAGSTPRPFLNLWVGPRYAPSAPLLQLFLVAALADGARGSGAKMAIGLGRVEVVSLSPLIGSLVNMPVSCAPDDPTAGSGHGVIWGTVLTTLFSSLPAYTRNISVSLAGSAARDLRDPDPRPTLGRRAAAPLVPVSWICRTALPPEAPAAQASFRGRPRSCSTSS